MGADMKKQFKLLNDSWIHLSNGNKGHMIHGKDSKYIDWIHCGEGKQQETFNSLVSTDETFYVDKFLPAGFKIRQVLSNMASFLSVVGSCNQLLIR